MSGADSNRRRRICSVVQPKLGIEQTENGLRTVVVDRETACQKALPSQERLATENAVKSCQERALSKSASFGIANEDTKVYEGASRFSRAQLSETFWRRRSAPLIDGLDNLQGINQLQVRKEDVNPARKTQRSISAHSATISAADCSILKDRRTGKIYKRGKLLGKGGFAKVYEGQEVSSGKRFAMKILDKTRLSHPLQRHRIYKEIEMHLVASAASHPNIAKFETLFENSRSMCLVLELCENRSLAQHLRKKVFLSEAVASDYLWQIVCGLSHIHGCGILHRDLKLGNILLSGATVKIADFGLAVGRFCLPNKAVCGTPNFIAPEVLLRQGHCPESDIWSLGCILYSMLVGKPPFESASLKETYKFILRKCYPIPQFLSSEAVDLIQWMLGAKPRNRPSPNEIVDHVFFLKHCTQTRLPSIDDLTKAFPHGDVLTENPSVRRRRSTASHEVMHSSFESCNSEYPKKVRYNSCSAVSYPFTTPLRNGPGCSIGPKLSVLTELLEDQAVSSARSGTMESCWGFTRDANDRSISTSCGESSDITVGKNLEKSPGQSYGSERVLQDSQKTGGVRTGENEKKLDGGSPVKLLARKLQKLRILSPKICAARPASSKTKDKWAYGFSNVDASKTISETTWVTKWVDYSNKYGFGYQLSNGKICVLFNNGTHIALLPDGKTIEYLDGGGLATESKTTFSLENRPSAPKVVDILMFFVYYMDNNLRHGNTTVSESQADYMRMLAWSRSTDRIAMYISNGTFQVNFCDDHAKINVSDIHGKSATGVTFVNKIGEISLYGSEELSYPEMVEPRRRLGQAHEDFHNLLQMGHYNSHPFCAFFDHAVGSADLTETTGIVVV